MVGLDEGRRGRRCLGLAHGEARASGPNWGSSLGQFSNPLGLAGIRGGRVPLRGSFPLSRPPLNDRLRTGTVKGNPTV